MKTNSETILKIMHLIAWVVFVGLLIEAGAILMSYFLSLRNPQTAKNLYLGLNLYAIMEFSKAAYTTAIAFYLAILLLKAFAAFKVVRLLSSIILPAWSLRRKRPGTP